MSVYLHVLEESGSTKKIVPGRRALEFLGTREQSSAEKTYAPLNDVRESFIEAYAPNVWLTYECEGLAYTVTDGCGKGARKVRGR